MFFESINEQEQLKFFQKKIKKEFFDEVGNVKINILDLIQEKAKHKRAKKLRPFEDWDIWDLGYVYGLYKMHLAIRNQDILIFAYLDSFSSHKLLVTNIKLSKKQKKAKKEFVKKPIRIFIKERNNFLIDTTNNNIFGFIYIVENI